ncbi:MAG: ester cyclase [Nitrososphaerota archaeon]|jgi:predicted SnoaL-like aldol condensation-catalyzing enzyme|nr:ester cyclase [Nitrososphaerota archaeon]
MSQLMRSDPEINRKNMALEFLRLAGLGKFKDGLRFFSPDCKTHNPYFSGSIEQLTDAMVQANAKGKAQYPNAEFTVKRALADGDYVAVQTNLLNDKNQPAAGGLRQMHLFRFEGDKIVEYWDITQQIPLGLPNSAGAF